jgi:CubicO group peptidase (beta-lactamase class C family)
VSLDKTIKDYLPQFENKPAAKVTVKQLLSHTSGIPNYDIIKDFFQELVAKVSQEKSMLKYI